MYTLSLLLQRIVSREIRGFFAAETGYRAQVTISMAVQSYREGRVLYFDPKKEKVVYEPPKV